MQKSPIMLFEYIECDFHYFYCIVRNQQYIYIVQCYKVYEVSWVIILLIRFKTISIDCTVENVMEGRVIFKHSTVIKLY